MEALSAAQQKMRTAGVSECGINVFSSYFADLQHGATGLIPESTIDPMPPAPRLAEKNFSPAAQAEALGKTAFLKLNGGLGTSMGMDKAKSLIPVRAGESFLRLICRQIRSAREQSGKLLPIIFMDSFRTQRDTLAALDKDMEIPGIPLSFLQGREPKLRRDNLYPVVWEENPELEWCPPGHGDIYTALSNNSLLEDLLRRGFRYLMTSNADNLGAYPSGEIAAWFAESGVSYAAEVCRRTPADRKGGHLALRRSDKQLILRDTGQTPPADMQYFTDEKRHPYFHTNNLWFNIEALRDLLQKTAGVLRLPLIRNQKTVDPCNKDSVPVYQLECAMGAIVEKFSDAQALIVERERFLPVKTTNDLFVLRSDVYKFTEEGRVLLQIPTAPIADLDPQYFRFIHDFTERTRHLPSLREVEKITVKGDYTFTGMEKLRGRVEIGNA